MGPLSYFIAFVCIALAGYYWYTNNKLRDEVKDSSRSDSTSSKPKSSEKFLDFDGDCKIRALKPSDLDDIKAIVKSEGGCQYFMDHSLEPYLNPDNKKCLGFGVELLSEKKIICTQFIAMLDDDETGFVLGAMMNMKYKKDSRIIYMRLSNDVQAQLSIKYDHLGKHRTFECTSNKTKSYLNNANLDWKIKFNLDEMTEKNVYYCLNGYDDVDGIKINGDFKESEDVDNCVKILSDKCKVNDVFYDWKLYQTKCIKGQLSKDLGDKKLVLLVNEKENGLIINYGSDDYYIYGETSKDILSGVRFVLSQNSSKDNLAIYVSKDMVDKDDELQKVFKSVINDEIIALDYDMHIDGH